MDDGVGTVVGAKDDTLLWPPDAGGTPDTPVPVPTGAQPLEGLVASHGTVEFGSGKGGASELDMVALASDEGRVPDGAALPTVELGIGNGATLDETDENNPDDGAKLTVPPLPVGHGAVEFDSGYGGLLVGILGAVPVPRSPPVPEAQDVGPPVAVWFVRGYGGNELRTVPTLVGPVTRPLVELDHGKGGALADTVPIPVPDEGSGPLGRPVPPVGPNAELELLRGQGGRVVLYGIEVSGAVPRPAVPVGPPVGPPAAEELLKG